MKKVKMTFVAQQIIEAGEHAAVIAEDGTVYVAVMSGLPKTAGTAEVADDTKKNIPPASASAAAAPAKTGKAPAEKKAPAGKEKEVEYPKEDWPKIPVGENVLITLDMDNYRDKKLSAEIDHIEDEGTDEVKVYVKYHEDGEVDYLRETDKVFKFKTSF